MLDAVMFKLYSRIIDNIYIYIYQYFKFPTYGRLFLVDGRPPILRISICFALERVTILIRTPYLSLKSSAYATLTE